MNHGIEVIFTIPERFSVWDDARGSEKLSPEDIHSREGARLPDGQGAGSACLLLCTGAACRKEWHD
ncbi:MAG: hypothetical protein ACQES0_08290 [Bacteroidota bacterium]